MSGRAQRIAFRMILSTTLVTGVPWSGHAQDHSGHPPPTGPESPAPPMEAPGSTGASPSADSGAAGTDSAGVTAVTDGHGVHGRAEVESGIPSTAETDSAKDGHVHERPRPPYTPVETLNGTTLPWKMEGGVKVFHLIAEPVKHQFAPGMVGNCWGYNGRTIGPTIEAVEGDHVRILVSNRLPEATSVHWHGILLPNGMDGVGGLNQEHIQPGETYAYEFILRQHGTQMYHPHVDENTQMSMGMMGFFIIHPKNPPEPRVDRDFAIFLMEWFIAPGTYTPNPSVMTDFNLFTFNSVSWPGTAPMVVRLGERVRIRLANLSMDSHPIHLHGHFFRMTGTDGGPTPPGAQFPETTVNVPVGATRDVEFAADAPGDWAFHCHKAHHVMGPMGHELPIMLNVDTSGIEEKIQKLLPGYMTMGQDGMSGMGEMGMPGPENTLRMMSGIGPHGLIEMGGMFTVLKIRDGITSYEDPGWYQAPEGTVAHRVGSVTPARAPLDEMSGMSHGRAGSGSSMGGAPGSKPMPGMPGMSHGAGSGSPTNSPPGANKMPDMPGMTHGAGSGSSEQP